MTSTPTLRIGTRGSRLALAQTDCVRRALLDADPDLTIEVVVIRTTGDKIRDRALSEIGGKGLFTKEIDEAILDGRVDLAVNSMKDVPTWLPDGIELACVPERTDPRDVLISRFGSLAEIPQGGVIGTASLRRGAQILYLRPDLKTVLLRGNVDTRLRAVGEGRVDATLLALAGLRRLGRTEVAAAVFGVDEILPAVGQGALGITARTGDARIRNVLAPMHDHNTMQCVVAERAMLAALDGSCHTPIAALAEAEGDMLRLRGLVARPDGSEMWTTERRGGLETAEDMGRDAGEELRARAGTRYLEPIGGE